MDGLALREEEWMFLPGSLLWAETYYKVNSALG